VNLRRDMVQGSCCSARFSRLPSDLNLVNFDRLGGGRAGRSRATARSRSRADQQRVCAWWGSVINWDAEALNVRMTGVPGVLLRSLLAAGGAGFADHWLSS